MDVESRDSVSLKPAELDGLVAVEYGKGSATGALFNEVPDRIADSAVLVGAGYAATGWVTLGYVAALLALFVLMGVLGPYIVPYDPLRSSASEALMPPSAAHWFGTDDLGRDVFSRVIVAARLDLVISVSAVAPRSSVTFRRTRRLRSSTSRRAVNVWVSVGPAWRVTPSTVHS